MSYLNSQWLSINLIENIVLLNGSYKDYKQIMQLIPKLNELKRRERIVVKLTILEKHVMIIRPRYVERKYKVDGLLHRENNLPAYEGFLPSCSDGYGWTMEPHCEWWYEGVKYNNNLK